jgi:hypothetical protein
MAINPEEEDLPPITILTPTEAREQFDARARELMGISGEEFLRRLDAGEYDEIIDKGSHPHGLDVVYLEMMRPSGS